MRMKVWQIGVEVAIVLAAGALTAVAIAEGMGNDRRGEDGVAMMGGNANGQAQDCPDCQDDQNGQNGQNGDGVCPNQDGDQSGRGQNGEGWGGEGQGGQGMMGPDGGMMGPGAGGQQGSQLTQEQRQQVLDIMNEHRADMQAWSQKYGDDPQSDAAQKALQELRTEHAQEMQKLFDELGIQGMGRGMGRGMWQDGAAPDANGTGSSSGDSNGTGSSSSSPTPGISY